MAIENGKRAAYTLEFKLEAVRLVQGRSQSRPGYTRAVVARSKVTRQSR